MWRRVSECSVWDCRPVERWWHAGLNRDGTRCLLFGIDSHPVIVWDVPGRKVVAVLDGPEPAEDEWPDLGTFLEPGGYYVIPAGPGAGRYRVFGIHEQHGRTVDERRGLRLEIDQPAGVVRVVRVAGAGAGAALRYEWFSGDWALASFTDDGNLFAVVEPYHVTFFAPAPDPLGPGVAPDRGA